MSWWVWIVAVYSAMSVITLLVYRHDKQAAGRGGRRTPEATLHLLELLGGWPGAFLAQHLVRHKNAKVGYQIIFWLIGGVHAAGWVAFARA